MTITEYEVNGEKLWRVYLNRRCKGKRQFRLQKLIKGIESKELALKEEKRCLAEMMREFGKLEMQQCNWEAIIHKWEVFHRHHGGGRYTRATVDDYSALLQTWTQPWLNRIPAELNRGDGRQILDLVEADGKSPLFCKKLKNTINVVFNWALEERYIVGPHHSPVKGLEIRRKTEEKLPEILSIEQVKALLSEAKDRQHPWYPIWAFTVLTGCRSGEVHGLRIEDIELIHPDEVQKQLALPPDRRHFGNIRLQRSWDTRFNSYGPLKSRYWRNVPVSSELYLLIQSLRNEKFGADEHGTYLLPRFYTWDRGAQAEVLRTFCREIGIPSIKFHTLRACFATHLIAKGVPSATVMKICGWRDLKTMERYIRLAGIDERGATEGLGFIPTHQGIMENVVNMFGIKA